MSEQFVLEFAMWGALGGLIATLVKSGCIELPRISDRKVYLGGFTGIVLGAVAGMIGDSNSLNAFMWGVGGTAIMQGLVKLADTRACVK